MYKKNAKQLQHSTNDRKRIFISFTLLFKSFVNVHHWGQFTVYADEIYGG